MLLLIPTAPNTAHLHTFRKQEPFWAMYWKWNNWATKKKSTCSSFSWICAHTLSCFGVTPPPFFISPLFSTSSSHDCFLYLPDTKSSLMIRLFLTHFLILFLHAYICHSNTCCGKECCCDCQGLCKFWIFTWSVKYCKKINKCYGRLYMNRKWLDSVIWTLGVLRMDISWISNSREAFFQLFSYYNSVILAVSERH